MGRLYHRFLNLLNISGRDLAVFLLALLLAFSIWLIHNLSLKYNASLNVTIQAECNIEGHARYSSDHSKVVARCRATGFNVLKFGTFGDEQVKVVRFQPSVMTHMADDVYYVTAENLKEYEHLIFRDGITVEYFTTDTLFFRFPTENSTKVPVIPMSSISFSDQYINEAEMTLEPDSVVIYGEPSLIKTISAVYTEPIRHSFVSKDIAGEAALEQMGGVRFSQEQVHYSMGVTRFVEFEENIKVEIINLPPDKNVTVFPSAVKVVIKCVFPVYANPLESCRAVVDYNEYLKTLSGKCMITLEDLSKGVIDYDLSPSFIEFIIED